MRTIFIKILLLLYFFAYLVPQVFCQYNVRHHKQLEHWYEDELTDSSSTYYRIFTPLCNQKDKDYRYFEFTWSDAQVEHCRQVWLKEGGLFKMTGECTFSEKNNYLNELKARCIAIDGNYIYIGTGNGIYLSTDYGERWLTPNEDGINNLTGKIINAISIRGGRIFAGTDAGIFVSTDNGASWTRSLPNCNITCIEFGRDNDVFVGSAKEQHNGIYKSSNFGDSWSHLSFSLPVYCLKYIDGMTFFAAVQDGFYKSTDEGQNWTRKFYIIYVTKIFIDDSDIYIGTSNGGCYKSTNGGGNFYEFRYGLPTYSVDNYYRINSLQKFGDTLYCATDSGLYKTNISQVSWKTCGVRDNYIKREYEYLIKMIYNDNNETLWVVCSESDSPKWPSAIMLTDYPEPMNPSNFPKFNCHSFAWHLSEGGITGLILDGPKDMMYISSDNITEWDYIETDWNDPLWDKVTYGNQSHSGIKSPAMVNMPDNEDDLIIDSKWGQYAPLVRHRLRDNPWGSSLPIKYWKCKKIIDKDTITTDRFIGRQLITDESESELSTIIPEGSDVKFYVAPMHEHKIHIKSGFYAERGSDFQAFIKDKSKDGCEIPWESEPIIKEVGYITASKNDVINSQTPNQQSIHSTEAPLWNPTKIVSELDTSACNPPWVEENNKFSGKGSGTKDDPFQITNVRQLQEMWDGLHWDGYWVLVNDIDASETKYWTPKINKEGDTIGFVGFQALTGKIFRSLDGQGFKIKNLYTSSGGGGPANFICWLACLEIHRVGFENIRFGPSSGTSLVMGSPRDDTGFVMTECYVTGTMESVPINNKMESHAYGFALIANKNAIIKNCYVDLEIITDSLVYGFGNIIELSYIKNMEGRFENSYAVVRTTAKNKVYSPFGDRGNVIGCFWDNDLYKPTEPLGKGIGLPTSEMMKRETFESAGWDFENVWYIEEGKDYPKLRAFKRDTTNVQERPIIKELTIKPNPASDYIEVAMPTEQMTGDAHQVRIYNMLGQCVINYELRSSNNEARAKIDIRHLPAGLYYIRIGGKGLPFVKN